MDTEKNQIYTIGKHHALAIVECPETGKDIYNIIEFPISLYQEENSYAVISNAYNLEDALMGDIEVLGKMAVKSSDIIVKVTEMLEKFDRYDSEDKKKQIKISREFCDREMSMPKDQLDIYFSSMYFNTVYTNENGELSLGIE
jgi:hypothetical protein